MKITGSLPFPHLRLTTGDVLGMSLNLLRLAILLCAIVLAAWWLTLLTAPRPVAKLPAVAMGQPPLDLMAVGRMFGTRASVSQDIAGLRLSGVFSNRKGGGFATFDTRKGSIAVFVGDEIGPGLTLQRIAQDHVVVLTSGTQREVRLRESRADAPPRSFPASMPGMPPVKP